MTAPIARSLPVLALWMAAVKLGLIQTRKKRQMPDDRQLELLKGE